MWPRRLRGAHHKFGGDLTRLHYLNNCVACGVPSYHFFNIWDFLNDAHMRKELVTTDSIQTQAYRQRRARMTGQTFWASSLRMTSR